MRIYCNGLRVSDRKKLEELEQHLGLKEILRQHPDLRPAEVYAALAYFHDHHDTIVAAIEAGKTQAERARGPEPFSHDELLRRRAVTTDRRP